ncbi:MAG: hypothetical protein AAFV93_04725 [Chloroflexota bacterium]
MRKHTTIRLITLVLVVLMLVLHSIAQEATPEATPEMTSEATAEITPEITPEVTPEITPEVTPEITPEPRRVTLNYTINGAEVGWIGTGIFLEAEDIYSISALGVINIWPNCEETKVQEGYPNLDCAEVNISPEGTDAFPPTLANYPLPDSVLGAMVARVGDAPAVLVGTGGLFQATQAGELQIAFNDIVIMGDNIGFFTVTVTVPEIRYVGSTNGRWQTTDIVVEAGQTFSILANGRVNIWSNCEETKVERGYPDIDCDIVTNLTSDGTNLFPPTTAEYPLAGANVGALVGRINGGEPFLIGAGGTFVADSSGTLELTVNDTDFFSADDEGEFGVVVMVDEIGTFVFLPSTFDDWMRTEVVASAGQAVTVDASGRINLWPRCEQEKAGANMANFDCSTTDIDPNGNVNELGDERHPLAGAPIGALIGKFSVDGEPFLIGAGGTFIPENDGELYIRVNDYFGMGDNEGGFTALITLENSVSNPEMTPEASN